MSKLNCEITVYGSMGHTQQILTGYFLLKREGILDYKSKIKKNNLNSELKAYHVKVVIEDEIIIYYDLTDGYEINMEELDKVNIYFKRSYLDAYINSLERSKSKKIVALGMNYCVFPNSIDMSNIIRSLSFNSTKDKVSSFLKALNLPSQITNSPKLKNIESPSSWKERNNRKILFLARTWNPHINGVEDQDRVQINEMRANCIRALRKEFGSDFKGGFSDTEHTRKYYKDCIFENRKLTRKSTYLNYIKQFPICVTTTGLHGSIGWKLGEYVAMSRAIVTEKLLYTLPGDFTNKKNYLEFNTVEECIEQTLDLYQNSQKRFQMMNENASYYYKYLKPDALVFNSILQAMSLVNYCLPKKQEKLSTNLAKV
jgi:hypothetical protein